MINNRHKRGTGHGFWNKEYKKVGPLRHAQGMHLALSNNPSEDLIKFTKWLERNSDLFSGRFNLPGKVEPSTPSVLDLGCGNGRNLIYLGQTYGIKGVGYDISHEATTQAATLAKGLNLKFESRSIAGTITLPDQSQDLVLDMMTSHFLSSSERAILLNEIARILKPGGWLYFKTFLRDEDAHAAKLLRERPAEEKGSYIHPKIGVAEHVFTEAEIEELFKKDFHIHKMLRSHRHRDEHGHAAKRRSISVYAEKI